MAVESNFINVKLYVLALQITFKFQVIEENGQDIPHMYKEYIKSNFNCSLYYTQNRQQMQFQKVLFQRTSTKVFP